MAVPVSELTQMVKMLTEEDYTAVIKDIEFLIGSHTKNTKATIRQIQEMLSDMAAFRRSRLA